MVVRPHSCHHEMEAPADPAGDLGERHVGDAGSASTAGRGDEEQGASRLARGCLAAILIAIFVAVGLPALIWAAAILIAGGR